MRGNERFETELKKFLQATCSLPPEGYTAGLGSGNMFLGSRGQSHGLVEGLFSPTSKTPPSLFLPRTPVGAPSRMRDFMSLVASYPRLTQGFRTISLVGLRKARLPI
jgi:hypothetical protein